AQAKLGFLLTTGNSRTGTVTAGTSLSRKANGNKISFYAGVAYARSSVLVALDRDNSGTIDASEITRQDQETANSWVTKLPYDRFFTEHNAAYVSTQFAADQPAGKDLVAGGQVGYSRQLYKTQAIETVGELGYDLSYEAYPGGTTPDSVTIH